MKNEHKDNKDTEMKILQAARQVFLSKGYEGARMQEIADSAGINKALLHYYFRKKENLFVEIIKQALGDFFPKITNIWVKDIPFDDRVRQFIVNYISFSLENPDLPRFFINVLYQKPELFVTGIHLKDYVKILNLQEILDNEAKSGRIKQVDAYQFIITILSLCIFPAISNPLLRTTFKLSEDKFKEMMEERKEIVPEIVLNWLHINNK